MKKRVFTGLVAMATVMALAGCGASGGAKDSEKNSYTIGIEQFAEHGSLDNCREGFLMGLEEEGIAEGENLKVEYRECERQIWERQGRFQTVSCLIKWI